MTDTKSPPYQLSNESITVVWEGKSHTVKKGTPHFEGMRKAILSENWADIPNHLTVVKSMESWAKGKFKVRGSSWLFNETPLPDKMSERITRMATQGEDPTRLFKFWERLQNNPSHRSVSQLFTFLEHENIPLDKEGFILAYKSVKPNYKDHHSGLFDNSPGVINEMPRNQVSDDPNQACDPGFHIGSLKFAQSFGGGDIKIVVCRIDPADVVSIPYDAQQQKMRVCKYKVIGNYSGQGLPSTSFDEEGVDEAAEVEEKKVEEAIKPEPVKDTNGTSKKIEAKAPSKEFQRLLDLPQVELLKEPIGALRTFASNHLKITGASKIPGGRVALVAAIMKVISNYKKG